MTKSKSLLGIFAAICLALTAMFGLAACGPTPSTNKVMTLSTNPEITFVIDGYNKVSSVQFNNEDAGTIYANIDFSGVTAEDAVQMVIETAAISGHIGLTLSSTANNFSIEVSGSVDADVQELENIAKDKATEVFETLGVTTTVVVEEISETAMKAGLVATATLLYPERDDLNNLTNDELITLIDARQREYADLTYDKMQEVKAQINSAMNNPLDPLAIANVAIEAAQRALDAAQDVLDAAQTALAEAQEKGWNTEALQKALNDARADFDTKLTAFKAKLADFDAKVKEKITEAKANIATRKAELKAEFNRQVEASSQYLIAHLDRAKENGDITQAQYDDWINFIKANKPATAA